MAKLQKFAALLAAGSVLGIFVITGPASAALAAPSGVVIKTADSVGTIESDDEDDDSSENDSVEAPKLKQHKDKLEDSESNSTNRIEKKRRELREKFGNKDSLGLPPIVIHPNKDDDSDDDDSDDDSVALKPKKKKSVALVSPSPSATPSSASTATADPSIITNSSSLKGGQLATSPSAVKSQSNTKQTLAPEVKQGATGSTATSTQKTQSNTLPEQQSAPIDIKNADVTGKTPTDKFFEASTSAIGAMAVGAFALGAMTIVRGKRQQKEQNAEYFYSSGE